MLLDPTVIVGFLSVLGTLVGSLAGVITANKLTSYRIEQLEKKVEKHNNIVERTYVLERDLKAAYRLIEENADDIKALREEELGLIKDKNS